MASGSSVEHARHQVRGLSRLALAVALLLVGGLLGPLAPARAAGELLDARVDLRVLVVDDGTPWVAAIAAQLDREGVPYTRIAETTAITPELLSDTVGGAPRAKFQAVVLPSSAPAGIDATEMATLEAFERRFGVRQVNAYLFPTAGDGLVNQWSGPLDGMTATVSPAGLAGPFGYLRGPVVFDDVSPTVGESYGYLALPVSPQPAGQSYEALLTAPIPGTGTDGALVGVQTDNGREEMIITGSYNANLQWFTQLAPGIVTWMTRGVHLGYQRNYFAVQVDDTFVPDGRWSISDKCTPGDDYCTATTTDIRMVPADVTRLVQWQQANNFTFDIAFNGGGSVAYKAANGGVDPLLDAFVAADATENFEWINHTLDHTFLGCIQIAPTVAGQTWRCATSATDAPRQDAAIPGQMSGGTLWAAPGYVDAQIRDNTAWAAANLPGASVTPGVLVTGEHSGLTVMPQQPADSPFFGPALDANAVGYTASDASRERNQRAVTGSTSGARTLPRYPMNIFYNVATFREEVSEYNWIYTSRADGGSGICEDNPQTSTCIAPLADGTNAAAQASFTGYILPLEVRNALTKVLTNDPRPFYAHQSNLAEDGILYPVVTQILDTYRARYAANAPLVKLTMRQQGDELARQAAWQAASAGVTAYLDAGGLTISGAGGSAVPVTVPAGSSGAAELQPYGGELSGWVGGTQVSVPDVGYRSSAPVATVPGAPTIGAATAGNASATVTWTAPASDGGSPLQGYTVRAFAGGSTTAATTVSAAASATSLVVTGLTNGTAYTFDVAAVNAVGTGPPSALSAPVTPAAVPAAPVITAVAPGNTSASVTWTAPDDNGSPITGYSVRAFVGTTNSVARTVSAAATATAVTVTGLTNGTAYTFDVRATNAVGTSPPSARSEAVTPTATATAPSAPTIGTVTPGNASAMVTWSPPADTGGATVAGYSVRAFTGTSNSVARTVSVSASATSANVLNLVNGNPYSFDVRAVYGTTPGAPSTRSEVVTPTAGATAPSAPTITAVAPGNASATVTWSPPADPGGATITGYRVRALAGTTNTVVRTANVAATASSATVTGLTNGSAYTFDVRAVYGTTLGPLSARSELVTLPATAPSAPRIGSASSGAAGGALTAIARWSPPTSTGGSPITGYLVTALQMSGGVVVAQTVSDQQPASARLLEMPLAPGNYRFTVQAVNAIGTGPASGRSNLVAAR